MYFIAYIPVREDVVPTDKLFRFKRVYKVSGAPHLVPFARIEAANSALMHSAPFVGQVAIPLIGNDMQELHETMEMLYEIGSEIPTYEVARLEATARLGHAFSTIEREHAEDELLIELDEDDGIWFSFEKESEFVPGGKIPVVTSIRAMFDELPEYARLELQMGVTAENPHIEAADVVDTWIMIHADGVRSAAKIVGAALKIDDVASQLIENVDERISNTAFKINSFLLRKLLK